MSKLRERLSPIQRQRTGTKFQTTLKRRGNLERGQGMAPVTMSRAVIKRETGLKRKGPTARATKHEGEYGERLAAGTKMDWKYKLFEALLERKEQEGDEAWKDFWKDKDEEGEKKSRPSRASKKTEASTKRAKKKEADANTKKFTKGTYKQQRGK